VCLGEYGTIVDVIDTGRAVVRFDDDTTRQISLAVLAAEGIAVAPGNRVMVSIGMALHLETDETDTAGIDTGGPVSNRSQTGREVAR
jgi:hypothetical protein